MIKYYLSIVVLLTFLTLPTTTQAAATIKTNLTYNGGQKLTSGWFLSSQSRHQQRFDVWQIDSGYAYSMTDNTQVYVSTHLTTSTKHQPSTSGLASGVKYTLSPKISINSAITSETINNETTLGLEFSSQYDVSQKVNVRATVDYAELEKIIELGLGFSF
ncbi:hypothetical protein [Photobacterium phosphoreum]|uniref:Outer membrane protein beta-barrel domain-containing protein n=1 Tax=Photobacterium phosphoreum TaxID=659 RepID=A0A2T3JST6_PHOPO|nr:hypothetical protein [Photobacterium phosphoreum]PSU25528.1 hypothetical protein CTM96_09320 [Photobacterium phosphoreum]PSU42970.1 hypothetical protein CTM97_06810 [Photobacterium phosphoreum]PSU52163.1 hypothetical protein C9J18_10230 [Photobacterium phosphoreum]PTB34366.1 hypothetical protein DAT36_01205 [Photobacterium phosphoreum]